MNDLTDTLHFKPLHESHSIEQVIFVVQFGRTLTNEELNKVRQIAMQFKNEKEMPASRDIPPIQFGMIGMQPQFNQNGLMLFRVASNGTIQKELKVDANSITFRMLHYTRWEIVWSEVKKYFEPILSNTIGDAKAFGLNYVDKFFWDNKQSSPRADYLLKNNSKYLCSHIFNTDELWHSHTGIFHNQENETKRLVNVNIDCFDDAIEEKMSRVITIGTFLTDTLLNDLKYESFDRIENNFISLHKAGKEILLDLINENAAKSIRLVD